MVRITLGEEIPLPHFFYFLFFLNYKKEEGQNENARTGTERTRED